MAHRSLSALEVPVQGSSWSGALQYLQVEKVEKADHDVLAPKSRMEVPPARFKSVLFLLHIFSG